MARAISDIVVDVPVRTAYDQWTQFEEFPAFMRGVKQVHQINDRLMTWRAEIAGREYEWEAEIREQVPDEKIVWRSRSGAQNAGIVTFEPVGGARTRVHLEMSYQPEGPLAHLGDALGLLDEQVADDLRRFKRFIEQRGSPTGAYRDEIENPDAPGGHTSGQPGAHSG